MEEGLFGRGASCGDGSLSLLNTSGKATTSSVVRLGNSSSLNGQNPVVFDYLSSAVVAVFRLPFFGELTAHPPAMAFPFICLGSVQFFMSQDIATSLPV